jgi:hypothetical protein
MVKVLWEPNHSMHDQEKKFESDFLSDYARLSDIYKKINEIV